MTTGYRLTTGGCGTEPALPSLERRVIGNRRLALVLRKERRAVWPDAPGSERDECHDAATLAVVDAIPKEGRRLVEMRGRICVRSGLIANPFVALWKEQVQAALTCRPPENGLGWEDLSAVERAPSHIRPSSGAFGLKAHQCGISWATSGCSRAGGISQDARCLGVLLVRALVTQKCAFKRFDTPHLRWKDMQSLRRSALYCEISMKGGGGGECGASR